MRIYFLIGLVASLSLGCQPTPAVVSPAAATGTVTIEVLSDDQTETYAVDDVAVGATLESVLRSDDRLPFVISGSGTTAFVNSIDGRETSGGEGWTYRVDGKFANSGIGSMKLNPPTTVTWQFGQATFE